MPRAVLPPRWLWASLFAQLAKTPPLRSPLLDTNEDAYWGEMRKQFHPGEEVYLNNGTVV
jgi:hypothetical protein